MRKSAKRDQSGGIESWAVAEAMHAIRFANVVAVVLDGSEPPTKQDLAIIGRCIDEGRAFILVVNKCDLMRDAAGRDELAEAVVNQVSSSIPQAWMLSWCPCLRSVVKCSCYRRSFLHSTPGASGSKRLTSIGG